MFIAFSFCPAFYFCPTHLMINQHLRGRVMSRKDEYEDPERVDEGPEITAAIATVHTQQGVDIGSSDLVPISVKHTGVPETVESSSAQPEVVFEEAGERKKIPADDKGKAIVVQDEPETADITCIKPTDFERPIEVKVYRKWTSRNVPDPNPTGLCFMLLDKKVSRSVL